MDRASCQNDDNFSTEKTFEINDLHGSYVLHARAELHSSTLRPAVDESSSR
jgi:hypothetical protein